MKAMYAISGLALVSAVGTAASGHMALSAFATVVGLAACVVAVKASRA
ncbi:hypothetical protein R20943_07840 [Paraburkholderia aspalathi]|nr:hypothetical protein R20943_07840 [Paraburkholderia aspalathi]